MAQSRPEHAIHAAEGAFDDIEWPKPSKPRWRQRKKQTSEHPVTGQALEDRRRQAQDRIAQGGWKADVAKMASEYVGKTKWKDTSSKVWGVFSFIKDAEDLGELCSDWRAIRQFLDKNIHKFIVFHAMEKDFKVPEYLIRKANQRRSDGVLKYPWLRSFIREYQGLGRTTADSLVQVYKDQGDELIADESLIHAGHVRQGGSSGGAIATTPGTMTMNPSRSHAVKIPSTQPCEMALNERAHGRKRQRIFDEREDLDIGNSSKKIKRESTEDRFGESQFTTQERDTYTVSKSETDHGKDMMHVKGRTLTVLFDGMRLEGDDESELVQVYVPRTSKGVTINFL